MVQMRFHIVLTLYFGCIIYGFKQTQINKAQTFKDTKENQTHFIHKQSDNGISVA